MNKIERRPNVLVITPHDAGDYLGCYGHTVETPNLDRLAIEGTRFANHFASCPMCAPARGSLITGMYPHTNGLMGQINLGWSMPDGPRTDAQWFSGAGYSTHLVGFQHEKASVADLGFEHVWPNHAPVSEIGGIVTELLETIAVEQARDGATRRPFYMRLGTISAHRQLEDGDDGYYGYQRSREDGISQTDVDVLPQWLDTPRLRDDLRGFTGEMNRLDEQIGLILDALRRSGLDEDTIVVYVVDHGIDYPRGKSTLYDLGIKTALLVRLPQGASGGTVVEAMTSHIDVLPTLLELCEIDGESGIQGVSLAALVANSSRGPVRQQLFAEENTLPRNTMRCVRTAEFKLIYNFDTGLKSNAGVCGMDVIEGSGSYYFVSRPNRELYDLAKDPGELENLAGQEVFREIETELASRLDRWMRDTDDPLLSGRIERPAAEREMLIGLLPVHQNEHHDTLWR